MEEGEDTLRRATHHVFAPLLAMPTVPTLAGGAPRIHISENTKARFRAWLRQFQRDTSTLMRDLKKLPALVRAVQHGKRESKTLDAALARIRRVQTRVSRGIRWFRRHSNDIQGRLRQMATQLMRQSRGWWDLARAHVHRFTAPTPAPTRSTGAQTPRH